jgi:membrane-bound lytic murein transglycosylase B
MSRRSEATDVALGIGVFGLRVGGAAARVALAPVALTMRAPIVGPPLRTATDRLAASGRRARVDAERWLERTASDAVESKVAIEVTDTVLQSAAVQHAIDHLAASPELRQAVADQTVGMAQQTMQGVRRRGVALDDAAERAARKWLRRQPPRAT